MLDYKKKNPDKVKNRRAIVVVTVIRVCSESLYDLSMMEHKQSALIAGSAKEFIMFSHNLTDNSFNFIPSSVLKIVWIVVRAVIGCITSYLSFTSCSGPL